jgi:hypothetical protein
VQTCNKIYTNSISFKEQRPFKIVVGCEDKSASFFEGPPFKFKLSLTVISNNNTNINSYGRHIKMIL